MNEFNPASFGLDIQKIRSDFPMLTQQVHGRPLIYFDSAATAQKPQIVIDALTNFYQKEYGTVHRAVYELAKKSTEKYSHTREIVCKFLGTDNPNEIIFTRGTTSALNLVAKSLGKLCLSKGNWVVISAMEHHANIVPWQMICEEKGALLKVIPMDKTGTLDQKAYLKLLEGPVKIVSTVHISNTLGTLNPVKEMAKAAHQVGAYFVLDGAQSAPHLSLNLKDLDCDFFAFSGHKVCAPTGVGVLYGKHSILEKMPPVEGGGDMIEKVTFEKTSYQLPPIRFEAGTPMIGDVLGLGVALNYMMEIGMEKITAYEHSLYSYLEKGLKEIPGLKILGTAQEKGALATFVIDGIHPLDLATLIDFEGVAVRTGHHCAQPVMQFFGCEVSTRASLTFYNTREEIDHFIIALKKAIQELKS